METIIEKLIESIETGKNNEIDYNKKDLYVEFLEALQGFDLEDIDLQVAIDETVDNLIPIYYYQQEKFLSNFDKNYNARNEAIQEVSTFEDLLMTACYITYNQIGYEIQSLIDQELQ